MATHSYYWIFLFFLFTLGLPGQTLTQEPPDRLRGKPLTAWTAMLQEVDPGRKRDAAGTLRMIGPWAKGAVPALMAVVRDLTEDLTLRRDAALALGKTQAKVATPVFQAALQESEIAMRYSAAKALGLMGPAAEGAIADLKQALQDSSALIQIRAAEALACVAPDQEAELAKAHLVDLGQDDTQPDEVRLEAALTLTELDPKRARTLAVVLRVNQNRVEPVRRMEIIDALIQINPETARDYRDTLVATLKDVNERPETRIAAARALYRVDPKRSGKREIVRLLARYLAEPAIPVRVRAAEALQAIDPNSARRLGIPTP